MASVVGFSIIDGITKSNAAFSVVDMKPFGSALARRVRCSDAIKKMNPEALGIREAQVLPFNVPPIPGLGTGSGSSSRCSTLRGGRRRACCHGAGCRRRQPEPQLAGVYTTFSAESPSFSSISIVSVYALGLRLNDVFSALQGAFASVYINDFNMFGRTWQVNDRAGRIPPTRRMTWQGLCPFHDRARWCRSGLRHGAANGRTNGDRALQQHPLGEDQRRAAPGVSGAAIEAMEATTAANLPEGYGYEWTGTALQEKAVGGQTASILGDGGFSCLPFPSSGFTKAGRSPYR